jgi:hypothetical protein
MARAPRLALISVLAITVATALSCGSCPPAPSITSISPSNATAGANQFLLTVNGNDFRRDSVVSWNGSFRVPSFVSSRQLVAAITAADIAQPGTVLVFVFNPPGGGTTFVSGGLGVMSATACIGKNSNAVSFTINPASVPITDAKAVSSVVEKFREKYGAKDIKKSYSRFDVAVVAELT